MKSPALERRAWNIAHAGLPLDPMFVAFDELLRPHIPYAIASWSTHDPATGLFTSCTMSGVPKNPAAEAQLFRCEFTEGEPASYRFLIGKGQASAILSEETDGDLSRASRYRDIFGPAGLTDELRAVLRVDRTAWGSATLLSTEGKFDARHVEAILAIARHVADGIRLALLRGAAFRPEAVEQPPGIVEVTREGQVHSLTAPAEYWLALAGVELITAANATAAALRARSSWKGVSSRLALRDGRILTLHAANRTEEDGAIAVIVDRARPAEVSAMIVDAYGLTRRQREVLGRLLLGRSMKQVARGMGVSEHTVQDHRKAIYQRMGVSSRSELAAMLQFEQYDPRVWSDIPPSPYGGFLENTPELT